LVQTRQGKRLSRESRVRRKHPPYKFDRRGLVEQRHDADALERGQHARAVQLGAERAGPLATRRAEASLFNPGTERCRLR
jgi:hypothetical protein